MHLPSAAQSAFRGRLRSVSLFLAAGLLLSACSASDLLEPIGIGPDRDQLKRSPCACFEILQNYRVWAYS